MITSQQNCSKHTNTGEFLQCEGALAFHSVQECEERERERESDWDFPQDLRKKEGERKQTVGATEDRNKYRRRENGWVVLCTGSFLFPTVEMT